MRPINRLQHRGPYFHCELVRTKHISHWSPGKGSQAFPPVLPTLRTGLPHSEQSCGLAARSCWNHIPHVGKSSLHGLQHVASCVDGILAGGSGPKALRNLYEEHNGLIPRPRAETDSKAAVRFHACSLTWHHLEEDTILKRAGLEVVRAMSVHYDSTRTMQRQEQSDSQDKQGRKR